MSEEDKERQDLATNRLLDLLRAQQAKDEPVEKKPETVKEMTEEEIDFEIGQETEESGKSLLESLKKTISHEEIIEEVPVVEEVVVSKVPGDRIKTILDEKKPDERPTTDLLQQIQKDISKTEEKENVVKPEEFDSTLLSTLVEQNHKIDISNYIGAVVSRLNDSQRQICIHRGENFLRLLQVVKRIKGTTIEKFETYTLPYKTNGQTISNMDQLLSFVLENELKSKEKKTAFGSYYDSKLLTKTHIIQTPKLKQKELVDLIQWNAKKNLPFNAENAETNWETTDAVGNSNKQNIVIGIGERNSIEEIITQFNKHHLKLRLFTTLPILLWKLFIKNYPDMKEGCYILVHIGETSTTIVVVEEHKLLYSREVSVGAEDFYTAIMQRIVVGNETVKIDHLQARQILGDYGFPKDTNGVIQGTKISLYKISIFLRPVLERLTSELSRSLSYFKKQNTELEWEWLLFDGIGATFPNLLKTIGQNLDLKVGILNPLRNGSFSFSDGKILPEKMLPYYTINFALADDEAEKINILPNKIRSNYKYLLLTKIAALVGIFLIPFFVINTFFSYQKVDELGGQIKVKTAEWGKLSSTAQEYFIILDEIEMVSGFRKFLSNDRIYSKNQIKILKLFSSVVPSDVKFTSITFKKEVVKTEKEESENVPQEFKDVILVNGFVQAEASVADIHFTNFLIQLQESNVFTKVDSNLKKQSDLQEGKLFFTLTLRL